MRKKVLVQADSSTGEVLDGLVVYIAPRRKNGFVERWFAMGQDKAIDEMLKFNRMEDLRVFLALLKCLDYENQIVANQAEIARQLSMRRSNVSSAIKRLVEAGAVLRGPKKGINCSYRLNPEFGWKGSAKGHVKALGEHREKRMKTANISGVLEGGKVKEGNESSTAETAKAAQPVRPMRKNRLFKKAVR